MVDLELTKVLHITKLAKFNHEGGSKWLLEHFRGSYVYNFDYDRLLIDDDRDYTLFIMRWA